MGRGRVARVVRADTDFHGPSRTARTDTDLHGQTRAFMDLHERTAFSDGASSLSA